MVREEIFGIPVNIFLMLLFVAVFFIMLTLFYTPQIRQGIFAFVFGALQQLNTWLGGV